GAGRSSVLWISSGTCSRENRGPGYCGNTSKSGSEQCADRFSSGVPDSTSANNWRGFTFAWRRREHKAKHILAQVHVVFDSKVPLSPLQRFSQRALPALQHTSTNAG